MSYTKPVCRGSWALGTACRRCERCLETLPGSRVAELAIVKPEDAALAARFWRVHPTELDAMGLTREQFYAVEIAKRVLQAIEAQRAETPSGSVHESAVAEPCSKTPSGKDHP